MGRRKNGIMRSPLGASVLLDRSRLWQFPELASKRNGNGHLPLR